MIYFELFCAISLLPHLSCSPSLSSLALFFCIFVCMFELYVVVVSHTDSDFLLLSCSVRLQLVFRFGIGLRSRCAFIALSVYAVFLTPIHVHCFVSFRTGIHIPTIGAVPLNSNEFQ